MPKKILIVDDEPQIVEICRDYLNNRIKNDRFACACFACQNYQTGTKTQVKFIYDRKVLNVKFGKHGLKLYP